MDKNLLKEVLLKRRSVVNPNLSSASVVSTTTTLNGYDTAVESFDTESLYFSMDGTLQDDENNISNVETALTAKKKRLSVIEPTSPNRTTKQVEISTLMLQSTPQILNKSHNIREEIPDMVMENSTLPFEQEKSTIVDASKLTELVEDKDKFSLKVLEKSVTLFRGEKENDDPDLGLNTNISKEFDDFKLDDSAPVAMKRLPIPTPRSTVLSPKNVAKPIPSPRKLLIKNDEPSAVDNMPKDADEKKPIKSVRMSISSRFRKSILPPTKNDDTNIPVKRTRKSIAPPQTVVPSTRILRKSLAPPARRSKSPVKKQQSVTMRVQPKTTATSTEMANKRRSIESQAKKRQSIAVKAKTPEKRRSTVRNENIKKRQSVAAKAKTPEKRRSLGRKSMAPAVATRQSIMPTTSRRSMMPAKSVVAPSSSVAQDDLTCDICKKSFRLKSNLTAHKRLHASNAGASSSLKCSFCDKTFALKIAYDNHLVSYCTKIPSNEKKKLMAQSIGAKSNDEPSTNVSATATNKSGSGFVPPKPPSKAMMHSGIERTPSKTIDCRIDGCNKKFRDPLAYSKHSTSQHSMSSSSSGDEK